MRKMVRHGHQVFAVAPDYDEQTRAALVAENITPVPVSLARAGTNSLRDSSDLVALARQLRSLKLDVLLSYGIKPVVYGTIAAKWAGIPHRYALIAGLGYAFGDGSGPRRWALRQAARWSYKLALSLTDRVFMQNPDDAHDFVRMGIVPAHRITRVNGTGVDLDAFPALSPVARPLTFILVARLLREKGIEDFVFAARIVRQMAPEARFLIVGGLDSNPGALSSTDVAAWVDEGLVKWTGHVDVRPYLAQSSVFVLPSYYREGIPRSILEALSSGRPVITTDTPGCKETVIPGENGFLVPPRDPDQLASAMIKFAKDPSLISTMGHRSRELAEEKFDIRDVNRKMLATMELSVSI